MNVKNETPRKAWGKLLPPEIEENEKLKSNGNEIDEVFAMLHKIPGCNDCASSA